MNFKERLIELGFEMKKLGKRRFVIYEYSDFEVLTFIIGEHRKVDKTKCIVIDELTLFNPFAQMEGKKGTYFEVRYPLYFDTIEQFLQLLDSLNYRINVKNI